MNDPHRSHWNTALALILTLGLVGCANTSGGRPPKAPTNLRTNDAVNPVGTGSAVYFGWHVNDADANEIQTNYQILVASSEAALKANNGDMWSAEVSGRQQNHVAYAGKPLAGDREYFWKVLTHDKDGKAGPWSAPARFVVGPIDNAGWSGAQWIWSESNRPDEYSYYRKKSALPAKPVARATVYISSAHKYNLFVNGKFVAQGPAFHHPQYQYYNGHDITSLVSSGSENVFAIFNRWWGGGQGRAPNARGVLMKAVIHHTDGTTTVVGTDGTWKTSPATAWVAGQGQHNGGEGVGFIERIDAANLTPNWNTLAFNDSAWANAADVGPHPVQPWVNVLAPDLTRITEIERTPVSVTDKGNGRYIVDLGKVYAAIPKISFNGGQAGTVINMQAGYGLTAAGDIDPRRNQNTGLRYFAVLSGRPFVYQPAEYFGFRYFQIENSPMPVTAQNFKFIERFSAMDRDNSTFSSSNPSLDAVYEFMKHSLFTCAQEEYVDTPSREKGGFLGDGVIQSTIAMQITNERLLTRRVMKEFIQSMEQHWATPENRGRMNAVYPNNDGGRDIPDFTQAYPLWVWDYYMNTGDKQFLVDNYGKLKDIGDYVTRHIDAGTGLVTNLTGGSGQYIRGIIDWPASMRYGYDMGAAARTVINGWAVADFQTLAKIAEVVGNTADRDAYRQRAEAIKSAINGKLINADGVYIDGLNAQGAQSAHVSQHANMFPLALGMIPPDRAAAVTAKVKELKMNVGMVTVMWLVKALGESDQAEHLIDLFTNPEWDGWARSLARGGTATWETWHSDTDGTSESHAWGAAGLYGYVHYILGISPTKPQFEEIRIKPLNFGSKLTHAKGSIPTDRGTIAVDWKHEGDRYTLKVTIPANVTANVYVPKGNGSDASVRVNGESKTGVVEGNYVAVNGIGSGTHTFVRTIGR